MTSQPQRPAFGTLLASHMAVATYKDGRWSPSEIKPVAPIELSPAAHVLHYASTCFEGFKAFRRADGSVHIFRMDRHIERMRQSARQLVLPEPDASQVADMVRAVINRCRDAAPEAPGALYLRPILFGTTANIGAAERLEAFEAGAGIVQHVRGGTQFNGGHGLEFARAPAAILKSGHGHVRGEQRAECGSLGLSGHLDFTLGIKIVAGCSSSSFSA